MTQEPDILVRRPREGTGGALWPRRIAVLGFLPEIPPVPRDMATLVDGLLDSGIEVDLLLPPEAQDAPLGITGQVGRYRLDLSDEPSALTALRGYARERAPDAMISNRDRAGAVLVRLPAGPMRRIVRNGTNVVEKTNSKHLLARWIARRRLASDLLKADGVICVSDGACADLHRFLHGRQTPPIARVYSPIDLRAVSALAATPAAHPWLVEKELPVVLSAGRLVRTKDYPTLLKAFRLLVRRKRCRLLVLGEGRQRPRLESLVRRLGLSDCVDLAGFVPNPFPYMARADLFVLSSRFEGFGNVLAEALAVGTPCVATDCRSGPREILDDGRYGKLVPVGDARALSDAMWTSLETPASPARLREAVSRFERDRVVAGLLQALRGMRGLPEEA